MLEFNQSKPLSKDTDYHTIDYLDFEFTPWCNYQTEAAFPTRFISGHTLPTGVALASRLFRTGTMKAVAPLATVALPFIVATTMVPGLPALRSKASVHGTRMISGGTFGAALALTAVTSFVASTTMLGLPTATTTAKPAMPTTAVAAGANIWHQCLGRPIENISHQRLGHPNERTMLAARNIAETGVILPTR